MEDGLYDGWTIRIGNKFEFETHTEDENGVVLPINGMKARMYISYGDPDGELALELTTENGCLEIVDNHLHGTIKTAQTLTLRAAPAVHEIEYIDSEGEVIGHLAGSIKIVKGRK